MSPHPEITINLAEPKEVFLPNNNYDHSQSPQNSDDTLPSSLRLAASPSTLQSRARPPLPPPPPPSPLQVNTTINNIICYLGRKHHHRAQAQTLSSFARFSSQTTVLKPRKHSLTNLCCLMMFFPQECLRRSTLLLVELEADE